MTVGSKQQLAVLLSKMKPFVKANIQLEQYSTDSEIAASILWEAYMQHEIEERTIADLGCGTGILGIGALALGAQHVVFIEIDSGVFPTLMENLKILEDDTEETFSNYELIHGNIINYHHHVDLVLQNPPFGTQEKHADTLFLQKALDLAPVIYSIHKTSTEEFLLDYISRNNAKVIGVQRYDFPLKATMAHHTKKIERIAVSCLKITH